MKKMFLLLLPSFLSVQIFANVTLPKVFGDNMVLQRNKPIPVWGWADANEKIILEFNHQTKSATADKNGKWKINLDKEAAGGPYQFIVKANNTVTFNNVLVGEVWICSGQSNMEFTVNEAINADKEMAEANYPQIRHIKVPETISATLKNDITKGEWEVCTPSTVGDFTAVGFFFARELYNQLKVPVGLINTSWGGTHVETWTSHQAFENSAEFKSMIAGMPSLNLDSLTKVRKEETIKKLRALQGSLPDTAEAGNWKNTDVDDSHWAQMQLPGLWEEKQLGDLDGVVWFRKTIDISASDTGEEAMIELAMIDDNDVTYVNGMKAGGTNSYNTHRKYIIPSGVLKEGKNVIAVRVEDTGGGGGIYGDSTGMKLTIENDIIGLAGNWAFKVEQIYGDANSISPNSYPTLLFNGMVNPLIPYAIEGAIWYQGESNADRAYQYRKAF
ncbi:MAG: sialate O-acetylesterase, partial [Ginsengibacter sp.]